MAHARYEVAETKLEVTKEVGRARLEMAGARLAAVHADLGEEEEAFGGLGHLARDSLREPSLTRSPPSRAQRADAQAGGSWGLGLKGARGRLTRAMW